MAKAVACFGLLLIGACGGGVANVRLEGERLRLAFAVGLEVNRHERGVIDRDSNLLDRRDQHVAVAVLAEDGGKQPDKFEPANRCAEIEPRAVPRNPDVEIAEIGRIPEVNRR